MRPAPDAAVTDRIAVLRAGKVVAEGTVGELRGRARQRVEVWFEDDPPRVALEE